MTRKQGPPKGLNERQRKFCELYAASGNASQAAIRAGYSAASAATNSDKLLKNTNVQQYLLQLSEQATSNRIATATERQEFWTAIMRGEVQDGDNPAKLTDRIKASELLGKAHGDFIERVEHSGDLGVLGVNIIMPGGEE